VLIAAYRYSELGHLVHDDGPEPTMRMLCRSVRLGIYRSCRRACVRLMMLVRTAAIVRMGVVEAAHAATGTAG
jgi:hypothetical protein